MDLLEELHEFLSLAASSPQVRSFHGLGGVGKTQLALEYAHRHRAAYQVVWWIRAEEPATLATDYAGLADSLGLVVQEDVTNVQEIIPLVRAWLEHHEDWLLIFDDVGDPAYLDEAWS